MSLRVVKGLWFQAEWSLCLRDSGGVLGTAWKNKSRQGLPEERNVADIFSVQPIWGNGSTLLLLKLAIIRSMKGSRTVVEASCCGAGFLISGGPRRDGGAIVVELVRVLREGFA